MSSIAAIDLGGSLLRTGWWQDGGWQAIRTDRTLTDQGQAGLLAQLVESVRSGPAASVLVLATAGTLNPLTGHVYRAANLPLADTDLRELLQDELGIPVSVIGDAVAATVAEFVTGAARGVTHGAYVTVSTGIGLGMVIQGSLVSGSRHQAGELGHIPVALGEDAPRCPCGQRGCLELFASGSGLAARFAERWPSEAGEPPTARDLLARAEQGDWRAAEVAEHGARLLGAALAVLLRLLSPDVVVLGGGLARSRYYVGRVMAGLEGIIDESMPGAARLVRTSACEPSNALVGAALAGANDPAVRRMLQGTGFESQLEDLL